jgi:hypothetical protein
MTTTDILGYPLGAMFLPVHVPFSPFGIAGGSKAPLLWHLVASFN